MDAELRSEIIDMLEIEYGFAPVATARVALAAAAEPEEDALGLEPLSALSLSISGVLSAFRDHVLETLTDEQQATVEAAYGHYLKLATAEHGALSAAQDVRCFREALTHVSPPTQGSLLLANVCLYVDGGLPSPLANRPRSDRYGHVDPEEGDPDKQPSHR